MALALRPYQQHAKDTARARLAAGIRKLLVVAPTGAGKCVTPDTHVWNRGLKRFGDVWGSDRIEGPHGAAQVNGWYDDGERDGYRVELECGLVIDGTPAHRVWVRNVDGYEGWRYIGELQATDFVAVARGRADFGDGDMPLDEAYALGMLIADGCIMSGSSERLQIDKQKPQLEALWPVVERWKVRAGGNGKPLSLKEMSPNHALLAAHAPGFRAMFSDAYGIDWTTSDKRVVPPSVLAGKPDVVRAFLRGYFDGDGYCSPMPGVSTSSRVLAEQVQQLLLGLGIYSALRTKETPGLPAHVVTVRSIDEFAAQIGFTKYGVRKDEAFAALMSKKRNSNTDVIPGVGGLIYRVAHTLKSRVNRKDPWKHADAYYSGEKMPGRDTFKAMLDGIPAGEDRSEAERLIADDRAWSRVASVTASAARRIDCEVDEQHAFIGNGIVNHNTVLFASIVQSAVERGTHVLVCAHRRELVRQPWIKFIRAGLDPAQVGVVLAGVEAGPAKPILGDADDDLLWHCMARRRPDALVQVASIDSIRNRAKPKADLIIIDEAHRVLSASYMKLAEEYPSAAIIGLTATPLRADSKPLGNFFEDMIVVATYRDLIREGFLVEPRVFTVPASELPDLSRVRIKGGDYDVVELDNACNQTGLVGDIVAHWQRHGNDAPTFVFAVSVDHSRNIAARFNDAGITAVHVDANTPTAERDAAFRDLRTGRVKVVANVDVATEGVDVVQVKTVVLARPTQSLRIYAQQVGRGSRPCDGGKPFVVLDHCGSVLNFGLPHMIEWSPEILHSSKPKSAVRSAPAKNCPKCFCVIPASAMVCPECGHEFEAKPRPELEEHDGQLVEVSAPSEEDLRASWEKLTAECVAKGYRPAWAQMRWAEQYPGTRQPGPLPSEEQCAAQRGKNAEILDGYVATALERGYTIGWIRSSYKARVGQYPSNDLMAKTNIREVLGGWLAGLGKVFEIGRAEPKRAEVVKVPEPANDLVAWAV